MQISTCGKRYPCKPPTSVSLETFENLPKGCCRGVWEGGVLRTRLGLGCGRDSESQAVTALPPEEELLGPKTTPRHGPAHAEDAGQAAGREAGAPRGGPSSSAATWDNLGVSRDSLGAAAVRAHAASRSPGLPWLRSASPRCIYFQYSGDHAKTHR